MIEAEAELRETLHVKLQYNSLIRSFRFSIHAKKINMLDTGLLQIKLQRYTTDYKLYDMFVYNYCTNLMSI